MRVVLDNSITIGWIHPQQATAYSTSLLDALGSYRGMAPALWLLEYANTLLTLQRRKKISQAERRSAINQALDWKIEIDATPPDLRGVHDLADRHGLTAYDAAYLGCALRNDAFLATQDAALRKAAQAHHCWLDHKAL